MKINLLPKPSRFLIKSAYFLFFFLVLVDIVLLSLLFSGPTKNVKAEDTALSMVEVPLEDCTGTAELYLYREESPLPDIYTSFTIKTDASRDQLLIFTRRDLLKSLIVEINGVTASYSDVIYKTGDFSIAVYIYAINAGDQVVIDGTTFHDEKSRAIQGYLAQDSANPIFDWGKIYILEDSQQTDVLSLNPGNYTYLVFDKYSQKPDTSSDFREVMVRIAGSAGTIHEATYNQPVPAGTQGSISGSFTISQPGDYDLIINTEDDIYWPLVLSCPGPICGDGQLGYDEECDAGADNGVLCSAEYGKTCTYCSVSCIEETVVGSYCGDGIIEEEHEQCEINDDCDDSDAVTFDACVSCQCEYEAGCTDEDVDGYAREGSLCGVIDCDDSNPDVNPAVTEICDGIDNNCDGQIDEGGVCGSICGDGVVEGAEECDLGADNGKECTAFYGETCSYCSTVCTEIEIIGPYCGDGVMQGVEECDDGDSDDTNVCNNLCEYNLAKVQLTSCSNSAELYLYQENPYQDLGADFTIRDDVNRDEMFVFTRSDLIEDITVKINGEEAGYIGDPIDKSGDFDVTIYKYVVDPGDKITIMDGDYHARAVQGYLVQDSSKPIYDIAGFYILNDGQQTDILNLNPGDYTYLILDKYSIFPDASFDERQVTISLTGLSGLIHEAIYNQPVPHLTEGALVGEFTIPTAGDYSFKVNTADDIYWPYVLSCTEEAAVCGDGVINGSEECEVDSDCNDQDLLTFDACISCLCSHIMTECSDGDHDGYAIEGGKCGQVDCNDADPLISPSALEICDNGLDDDCDGFIDQADYDCQECTSGTEESCGQSDIGACQFGSHICQENGSWGECLGFIDPIAEICGNGSDDDCDGLTDLEDVECQRRPVITECVPGVTRQCGTTDTGICEYGTQTCQSTSLWGACIGAVQPAGEICNGFDDDCDGATDEDVCMPTGGGGGGAIGTPPEISLSISNERVSCSIVDNSAVISWNTDNTATSRVIFGLSPVSKPVTPPNYGYTSSTIENLTYINSHSVTVSGLTPNTTYYFRPVSKNSNLEVYGQEVSCGVILGAEFEECLDCDDISYDLYIVNPDGSERYWNSSYGKTERVDNNTVLVRFEDSGVVDKDYNDLVMQVTKNNCLNISFKPISRDAAWKHQIKLRLRAGRQEKNLLLWPDSNLAVRNKELKTVYLADHIFDICEEDIVMHQKYLEPSQSLTPPVVTPGSRIEAPVVKLLAPIAPIASMLPAPISSVPPAAMAEEPEAPGKIAGAEFEDEEKIAERIEPITNVSEIAEEQKEGLKSEQVQSIFDSPFAKWILLALIIVICLQIVIIVYIFRSYQQRPETLLE